MISLPQNLIGNVLKPTELKKKVNKRTHGVVGTNKTAELTPELHSQHIVQKAQN